MSRPPIVIVAVALLSTGCGQIGPFGQTATFPDYERQLCVETALRRSPDMGAVDLAFERFSHACEDGDPAACSALGVMYEQGLGTAVDDRRAAALYEMACKAGNEGGCLNLGLDYSNGVGVDFDSRRAAELFTNGCSQREPRACTELAALYVAGDGVQKDTTKAAQLYAEACDVGRWEACYAVAKLHDDGIIGPDPVAALTFYERACVAGYGDSCDRMDALYSRRLPPARVAARDSHPSEKPCMAGDAAACNAAGVAFYSGSGVTKDTVRAATYLTRACDGGYDPACNVLKPLLHGACARGERDGCAALKRLANR